MIELVTQGDGEDHFQGYSGGSMTHKRGIRYTGFGVVAYHNGKTALEHAVALGPFVVVYDTELEGMAVATEQTRDYHLSLALTSKRR